MRLRALGDQIGRIGIHMQHHIAGMVSDDSVGVSGSVIEELVCSGVTGRTGLLRGISLRLGSMIGSTARA
jgi:hypothetical protein